ncbi:MAG TPA: GAF domain-containing sensor histidine kinase [Thermoanaerobaculia bacterium]|nr:GAF domain-containing sensor histidine kinase [Thermoanaerobaculia bacterium]
MSPDDSLLFAALRQLPAAVVVAEAPSGRVVLANEQAEKILRGGAMPAALQRALRGERVGPEDVRIVRGDGANAVIRLAAQPIDGGAVLAFIDVTSEAKVQDALELGSLELGATVKSIVEMAIPRFADVAFVYLLDENNKLLRHEVAAADRAVEQKVRRMWDRFPIAAAPLYGAIERGQTSLTPHATEEMWSFVEDPEQRRAMTDIGMRSIMTIPLRAGGTPLGAMVLARTTECPYDHGEVAVAEELARRASAAIERARLFDSERRARRDAEQASQAKDEFLAILSHELRTPMTTVIGWADLLRLTYDGSDPSITMAIESLRAGALTQARLIDDLLDVSRIITGKLQVDKQRTNLSDCVVNAAEALRITAENKGLTLRVDGDGPVWMEADPARLRQIVTNLVANAIKFTPSGGAVDVRVQRHDGSADLIVRDTGEGIAPDFLPYVFERFRQASIGDSRLHTGLGLGLSIVHHLVQLHGGSVRAESEGVGKGATFTVTLPTL